MGVPAEPPPRGDFIALLQMIAEAFPLAPVIVVICDNDSIHHARTVTAYLEKHPRLELLYGARYSPHDNPAERIWAALKNYVANTAVSWPGRLRQIHAFFRSHSPDQMLATAAPWTSPWLPPGAAGLRAELLEWRLGGNQHGPTRLAFLCQVPGNVLRR
jgi:transposase